MEAVPDTVMTVAGNYFLQSRIYQDPINLLIYVSDIFCLKPTTIICDAMGTDIQIRRFRMLKQDVFF